MGGDMKLISIKKKNPIVSFFAVHDTVATIEWKPGIILKIDLSVYKDDTVEDVLDRIRYKAKDKWQSQFHKQVWHAIELKQGKQI